MRNSREKVSHDFGYVGEADIAEEFEASRKIIFRNFKEEYKREPTNDESHLIMFTLAEQFGASYAPDRKHLH